jgi:hypothetical protein
MSSLEVRVGHVYVLLLVVPWVLHSTVCLITHEHPHELVLSCQQVLNADRCPRWRWWWIGMWNLPMTTTTASRAFKHVKCGILGGSGSHCLS